jgi:hypothetical protein
MLALVAGIALWPSELFTLHHVLSKRSVARLLRPHFLTVTTGKGAMAPYRRSRWPDAASDDPNETLRFSNDLLTEVPSPLAGEHCTASLVTLTSVLSHRGRGCSQIRRGT